MLKIGVAAVNFYYMGKPIPIEKEKLKFGSRFKENIESISKQIAIDLKDKIGGVYVRELPIRYGWNLDNYRDFATKQGFDILLFYDVHIPSLDFSTGLKSRPDTAIKKHEFDGQFGFYSRYEQSELDEQFDFVGQLMLLQTGETWGQSWSHRRRYRKDWVSKLTDEAGKVVPIWYYIRSDPSNQICSVDGEVKGLTPKNFSAFRIVGGITRIEVHFDNPKVICRRKDIKVEYREQIINETFKPGGPKKPPCQSDKSRK